MKIIIKIDKYKLYFFILVFFTSFIRLMTANKAAKIIKGKGIKNLEAKPFINIKNIVDNTRKSKNTDNLFISLKSIFFAIHIK